MKSTTIEHNIQLAVQALLQPYPSIAKIVHIIHEHAGRTLLVGGAVRDIVLGNAVKDIDIEVHGISVSALQTILAQFGMVNTVGKSFGVLTVRGIPVEWALPRLDTAGRKPHVVVDPYLPIRDACARRDLTINAMCIDLLTYELLDPFNGRGDLERGILRAPDPVFFIQDPLRFYRVMQFIGRFEMQPDEQLTTLCRTMDISSISRERIEKEIEKLLLKSWRPSWGFRWLYQLGRMPEIFPELAALRGCVQSPIYHPEGDVFEHSMQALDAAAQIDYDTDIKKLILRYAALCHDMGKPLVTTQVAGVIRSIGHEVDGVPIVRRFLHRIMRNQRIISAVLILVRYHMMPAQLVEQTSGLRAYKRLAKKLGSYVTMQLLADLFRADRRGRHAGTTDPLPYEQPVVDTFIQRCTQAGVLTHPEAPLVSGRDLLPFVSPGPALGKLVKRAYELQIEHGVTDRAELLRLLGFDVNKDLSF